jgi:putative transposase
MDHWKEQSSKQIKQLYLRDFPNYLSKTGDDNPVWQARYYPFPIYSDRKLQEKLDYMHTNPVTAGLAAKACDWPWSSARWYLETKSVGVPIGVPPGIGV